MVLCVCVCEKGRVLQISGHFLWRFIVLMQSLSYSSFFALSHAAEMKYRQENGSGNGEDQNEEDEEVPSKLSGSFEVRTLFVKR